MKKKIFNIINKKNKSKIVCLTAYSKNIASILDNFCDIVLVGDSLGSVLYNYKSTREVTLSSMIEHSKSVRMGIKKSLMVMVTLMDLRAKKFTSMVVFAPLLMYLMP